MNSAYWLGLAGLLSTGLAAAEPSVTEPPAASNDEPSLELLEFLAEYGSDSGELDLPAELDAIDAAAIHAPPREQTAEPVKQPSPTGKGDQTP